MVVRRREVWMRWSLRSSSRPRMRVLRETRAKLARSSWGNGRSTGVLSGGEGGAGGPVPGVADGTQRLLLGGVEPVPGSRLTFRAAHVDFLPEFHLILRRFRRRVSMGRLRTQSALGHHHGKRIGA